MGRDTDDEAWRAIVENYGDRVELGNEPAPDEPRHQDEAPIPERRPDEEDRFVPPPPPPLPLIPTDRLIAWACLFGSPTILLVVLVLGLAIPSWLGYLLVAGFVGGFAYLVAKMPRGPADPWDDGARL